MCVCVWGGGGAVSMPVELLLHSVLGLYFTVCVCVCVCGWCVCVLLNLVNKDSENLSKEVTERLF